MKLEKIRNALTLVKACWKVLMLDKELLLFPLMSLTVLVALILMVFGQFGMFNDVEIAIEAIMNTLEYQQEWVLVAFSFLAYFIAYFVIIFFNAAMIACVNIRFAGGNPSVADGLRFSISRLPQILAWAAVTATVGFVLGQLEKKNKGIVKFLLRIVGAAWAVSSYFVVPVLVSEKIGPIGAVKRSVSVIRKTWGESLVSVVGLSILSGIAIFIAFGAFFLAIVLVEFSPVLAISLGVAAIGFGLFSSLVITTLSAILKAALYIYAVDGKIPDQFDDRFVAGAFSKEQK